MKIQAAGYFLMYQKVSNYFGTTLVFIIYSIKDYLNNEDGIELTNNNIINSDNNILSE